MSVDAKTHQDQLIADTLHLTPTLRDFIVSAEPLRQHRFFPYVTIDESRLHKDEANNVWDYDEEESYYHRKMCMQLLSKENGIIKFDIVENIFDGGAWQGQIWSTPHTSTFSKQGLWTFRLAVDQKISYVERINFIDGVTHGLTTVFNDGMSHGDWYYQGLIIPWILMNEFIEEHMLYRYCQLPRELARMIWGYVAFDSHNQRMRRIVDLF